MMEQCPPGVSVPLSGSAIRGARRAQPAGPFHAGCSQCCAVDACHFCLGPARESWLRSDGTTIRVCQAHDEWLASSRNAPVVDRVRLAGLTLNGPLAPFNLEKPI